MQLTLDLGADVDSRFIWIACAAHSFRPYSIENNRRSILTWLRTVPRASRLGVESTGTYHELISDLAHKAGLQVFVLNPRDVRRYGQGVGYRGKTDRVSAEVLARYVAREQADLHAYVPPSREQRALHRLMKRRAKLVVIKGALMQSLRGLSGLGTELKALMKRLDRLIAHIDVLSRRMLQKLPAAYEAAQHIETIPGYGPLGSTYLGQSFTRHPFSCGDSVVAFSGLDPRAEESGLKRCPRRLSKRGPSEQRRILFNCARSASRTKVWRPYYQAQLAKGLSATAATVILARKMLRVAFAVYKHKSPFDPTILGGRA